MATSLLLAPVRAEASDSVLEAQAKPEASAPGAAGSESRPSLLNESSSLPGRFRGYVVASGGVLRTSEGASAGAAAASGLWSFASQWAFSVGGSTMASREGASTGVLAAMHFQPLVQARAGIDLVTSVRFQSVGPEGGPQASLRAAVGRAFGRASLAMNGAVGQGIGERSDIDFETGSTAFLRFGETARVGGEVRIRGEVVDRYETAEDSGRAVDVVAGVLGGVDVQPVLAQLLTGWSWPRGPYGSGPVVLANATFSF